MVGQEKIKHAMFQVGGDIQTYPPDHEGRKVGIEKIGVMYEFVTSTKLKITPRVAGQGWNVGLVAVFDLSDYFKASAAISEEQLVNIIRDLLDNHSERALWTYEVKGTTPPFYCEVGEKFGGISLMIVVCVIKPKKPVFRAPFVFGQRFIPAVTFVFGFGADTTISRWGKDYWVLEKSLCRKASKRKLDSGCKC